MSSVIGGLGVSRDRANKKIFVAVLALGVSLVLGGGTRSGFLADAVLQLLSIPLLVVALASWVRYRVETRDWNASDRLMLVFALTIWTSLLGLHLIQLVPLPLVMWSRLGGSEIALQSYELLGIPPPWRPVSVAPHATLLAFFSFVPVLAVFLITLQLDAIGRRNLVLLIVSFATVSSVLGMFQILDGPDSALRPFDFTNRTEAVGLFANRNHFAALLYAGTVFLVPWAIVAWRQLLTAMSIRSFPETAVALVVTSVIIFAILICGQVMARSRAGLVLTLVGIVVTIAVPLARGSGRRPRWKLGLAIAIVAGMFFSQYSIYRMLERFDTDLAQDSRITFARNTIEAALVYMPFGSGIGSFVTVYDYFEKKPDLMNTIANRAHNDLLEAWLETGAVGVLLFVLFIAWYLIRVFTILSHQVRTDKILDQLLACAAAIVVGLLICHSLVDYPLRTGSMAAVLAFCVALMLPPPSAGTRSGSSIQQTEPASIRPQSVSRSRSGGMPAEIEWPTEGAEHASRPESLEPLKSVNPAWPGEWEHAKKPLPKPTMAQWPDEWERQTTPESRSTRSTDEAQPSGANRRADRKPTDSPDETK